MSEPENRWSATARPKAEVVPEVPEVESPPQVNLAGKQATVNSVELSAIVGAGTAFSGSLSFSGKVRIDGQFEGTVLGGDVLVIGEGARVSGKLRARQVLVLGGWVDADIQASEIIELYLPAVVTGDLKSPQIYMDRGIQFHGTCDMTADPPAVEDRGLGRGSEI